MTKTAVFKELREARDYMDPKNVVGERYELYGQCSPRPIDSMKRYTNKNTEWVVYWEIYRLDPSNPDEPICIVSRIYDLDIARALFHLFEGGAVTAIASNLGDR